MSALTKIAFVCLVFIGHPALTANRDEIKQPVANAVTAGDGTMTSSAALRRILQQLSDAGVNLPTDGLRRVQQIARNGGDILCHLPGHQGYCRLSSSNSGWQLQGDITKTVQQCVVRGYYGTIPRAAGCEEFLQNSQAELLRTSPSCISATFQNDDGSVTLGLARSGGNVTTRFLRLPPLPAGNFSQHKTATEDRLRACQQIAAAAFAFEYSGNRVTIELDDVSKQADVFPLLERLAGFTYLELIGHAVTDDVMNHVCQLSTLTQLKLTDTQVTATGLAQLQQVESLGSLAITDAQLTGAAVAAIEGIPNLTRLSLKATGLDVVTVKAVQERIAVRVFPRSLPGRMDTPADLTEERLLQIRELVVIPEYLRRYDVPIHRMQNVNRLIIFGDGPHDEKDGRISSTLTARLMQLSNVQMLTLSHCRLSTPLISGFRNLKQVTFRNADLSTLYTVTGTSQLEHVTVAAERLSAAHLDTLTRGRSLRTITLAIPNSDEQAASLADKLPATIIHTGGISGD